MKSPSSRSTNLALLVLLPAAVVSGLVANTIGTPVAVHPSVVHGVIAIGILVLAPWKQAIVRSGLRKRRPMAKWSLALLTLVLITIASGLIHAFGYQGRLGPLTVMQVHIGAALTALVLVWVHYRSHPVRFRRSVDVDRRAFLRTATFSGAAILAWLGLEGALDAARLPGGDRRFTGSHERASFQPDRLPVTSWLDDRVQQIDPDSWRLRIGGRPLTLGELEQLPMETFDATLDCTSAWYSEQSWRGVRLDRLVDPGSARSLVVTSATGYARRFPTRDLAAMWLVTEVGGAALSAGHGFPARIVAPGRRGFWWVKWVVDVQLSNVPWWVQLPFPAT